MDIVSVIMAGVFIVVCGACVALAQAWLGLPFWAAALAGGVAGWILVMAGVLLLVWLGDQWGRWRGRRGARDGRGE